MPTRNRGNRFVAKVHDDRVESVVTARAAIESQTQTTEFEREIIEHNQSFGGRDLVKIRDRGKRLSAAIHEAGRLDQDRVLTFRPKCVPAFGELPAQPPLRCEIIDDVETDVVAGALASAPGLPRPTTNRIREISCCKGL